MYKINECKIFDGIAELAQKDQWLSTAGAVVA